MKANKAETAKAIFALDFDVALTQLPFETLNPPKHVVHCELVEQVSQLAPQAWQSGIVILGLQYPKLYTELCVQYPTLQAQQALKFALFNAQFVVTALGSLHALQFPPLSQYPALQLLGLVSDVHVATLLDMLCNRLSLKHSILQHNI